MGAHMEPQTAARPMSLSERADELEERMMHELNAKIATKSVLFNLADGNREMIGGAVLHAQNPGKYFLMGADPRLPKLPDKPTLLDFLKYRFVSGSTNHLLQSATLALKAGHGEKVVLACLLHDIGVAGFIRCDHGYWGAQLIEPYVDEEVSWAVRVHQALRFFPDESVGYKYPDMYLKYFGPDYKPEPYIEEEYKRAQFQAAEGRAGFRQHPILPHVADPQLADPLSLIGEPRLVSRAQCSMSSAFTIWSPLCTL